MRPCAARVWPLADRECLTNCVEFSLFAASAGAGATASAALTTTTAPACGSAAGLTCFRVPSMVVLAAGSFALPLFCVATDADCTVAAAVAVVVAATIADLVLAAGSFALLLFCVAADADCKTAAAVAVVVVATTATPAPAAVVVGSSAVLGSRGNDAAAH